MLATEWPEVQHSINPAVFDGYLMCPKMWTAEVCALGQVSSSIVTLAPNAFPGGQVLLNDETIITTNH